MSKKQAASAPQAGSEHSSYAACGANPAPTQQETCEKHHKSWESDLQALALGASGYGSETSVSAMAAAQGSLHRHVSYVLPAYEAGEDGGTEAVEQSMEPGGAGNITSKWVAARPRPSHLPPSQRRRRLLAGPVGVPLPPPGRYHQNHIGGTEAVEQSLEPGGAGSKWVAARPRPSYVPPSQRRRELMASPSLAGPGGLPLPPPGSTHVMPHGAAPPSKTGGVPTARTIEGVTTLTPEHSTAASQRLRPRRPMRYMFGNKRHPEAGLYRTACGILSCLLAFAIGFALLVVYLRYHPQSPRMRVTKATLNGTLGGQAPNCSLSIQADIYNPNTELHVVLRYIQLDLYFQGSLIGTQAVWPAPIHEAPGDSVLRSVHVLVSVTQERDVSAWRNVTNGNGTKPLELRLVGRFHSQLNLGRWLPFRFWVYPRCTLWLDLLRGGALRQSWC